jgi:thiazole/oxazole-forming peptide maturase SagD family component
MVPSRTVPAFEPPHRSVSEPDAVTAYRRALPEGEVLAYPLDPLDYLGVPVWSAELFAARGTAHHGVGYGESDPRAEIGAFGELSETLFAGDTIKNLRPRRASYDELLHEVGPRGVVDPLTVCLPAGSGYAPGRTLRWVEARRWATGENVYVPLELAAASPVDVEQEGEWLVLPVTNGLGAGPTIEHAMAHGLLELVQRDGNSATYRALDAGVGVRLDSVESAATRALLEKLDRVGIEITVKLAATDFGIANLYVVGVERDPQKTPHPLALTACGEAADPDRERALSKALMEFCAGRARKPFDNGPLSRMTAVAPATYVGRAIRAATLEHEESRALREAVAWLDLDAHAMRALLEDPVLAVRSEVAFSSLPKTPDLEAPDVLAGFVARRLREAGLDPLYVDFSPPGGEVRVVKAIVPGLEVETGSYSRIGARNLRRLLRREDGLVGTHDPPAQARPILLPKSDRDELGPRTWLDVEALHKTVGRLYPLYREPSRHVTALVASGVLGACSPAENTSNRAR